MAKNYVPELLAPAGSLDALKAAVNAGANAVYISGKKFGARKFASNFSKSEIVQGLEYAKIRAVKVYVTVNTLIKDSEINSVLEYILWLYKVGVDAIIVQDLGIAYLCREIVPELDIHASTQMTVHNIEGVKWAAEFGFKRVVLSRELNISEIEEIKKISDDYGIEIEIFGHGALCYSYSGQCLLSSFIGGRSGNRGMCAQPCRKEYELITGKIDQYGRPRETYSVELKEKYLLSTKDLAVYRDLEKISRSNIDSLKIEGRMRSSEYVAIVVNIYRKALDQIAAGKWKSNYQDISKLKLAFNREFTGGYLLESSNRSVMGRDAPGNRGLYIGNVTEYNKKSNTVSITAHNKFKIDKGDGIVFISPQNTFGMALETTPKYKEDKLILKVKRPVKIGSKMYLTRSISLNHEAAEILTNSKSPSIPMEINLSWDNDLKLNITGIFIGFDKTEYYVDIKSDFKMEIAIKRPLSVDQIEYQLKKTGKTPFILRKISIEYPGDLFAPISKLNHIRREFLKKAELMLLKTITPKEKDVKIAQNRLLKIEKNISVKTESFKNTIAHEKIGVSAYVDSLQTVNGALEGGAKRIYFELETDKNFYIKCNSRTSFSSLVSEEFNRKTNQNLIALKTAQNLCETYEAVLIWKWPQITHEYQINMYKTILESDIGTIDEIMVDGLGAGEGVKQFLSEINLSGSAGLNIWNIKTVKILSKNFNTVTPSAELSRKDLRRLISSSRLAGIETHFDIVVQGNVDTLISNDCILSAVPDTSKNIENEFWGIQDLKKRIFPIKIDSQGNTHILNSVELCLVDHLPDLIQMGVNGIVVDLRNKTNDYAKEICSIYCKGLEYIEKGINTEKNMNKLKSKIKGISTGGITTGNYLKGVKED